MKSKQLIKIGVPVLVALALLVIASTALAATVTGNLCGNKKPVLGANGLSVKKSVFCEKDSSWEWEILKEADTSSLTLSPGQTATIHYDVTVNATPVDSNFHVSGYVAMLNNTQNPITIVSVTDSLGQVDCPVSFPYVLGGGMPLVCTYAGDPASEPSENVATVTDSNGVAVIHTVPIDWSQAAVGSETDQCVDVTDSFANFLGNVCAGDQTSFEFSYDREVSYEVCGEYTVDNTASFETEDTGTKGEASVSIPVDVPCEGGCTLTPGYWKTHSSYGPAPYDDTWAQIGEDTAFFSSGKSYYEALWTSPQGNAYYILAHAYIAAELNQLNGADFSDAQAAFDAATALFSNPANTPAAVGALRGSARNVWINLADTLDDYNNGLIGPGHCTE
jgi:hypothetical protein